MRPFVPAFVVAAVLVTLNACVCGAGDQHGDAGFDAGLQGDSGQPDAGPPDAGQTDAGAQDAGDSDAGQGDAGQPDAGAQDAGLPDGGGVRFDDAGCPLPTGLVLNATDAGLPALGLRLWLKADTAVATFDGGAVCRWEDLSGNGYHFTPGTPTPPMATDTGIRGRPSVSFLSNGHYLLRSDVLGIAPDAGCTIAVISLTHDTTHRWESLIMGTIGSPGTYVSLDMNSFNTAGSKEGVYVTNNAYDSDLATSAAARTHVMSVESLVPGGDVLTVTRYAVNGTPRTLTRNPGGLGNGQVEDFSSANFTALGGGDTAFTGAELGDVLVYDRALTDLERAQVEAYLNARYP